MEDNNDDLASYVLDGTEEPEESPAIVLSPTAPQPLKKESAEADDTNNTNKKQAPKSPQRTSIKVRSKSASPRRSSRSKSPGALKALRRSLRDPGLAGGGEGLESRSSTHGKRSSLANSIKLTKGGGMVPRISWKSDPKASYCDWRIQVNHMTKKGTPIGNVDVYNIHRNVVGFGPRKSNFMVKEFNRQIEDKNYVSGANITVFPLPFWQAEAFPMVLDFMYHTKEAKQTLTAERACSVFKIAEMMEIPPLEDAIENFYRKTLSLKNMTEFMAAATKAKADRLLFASRAKIGSLILEKPELAGLLLPKFMVDILQINKEQVREIQSKTPERYPEELKLSHSRIWSKAAFVCASHNAKVMTKEVFDAMTHEDCLPAIDVSIAFKLVMMDAKFDPNNTEYNNLQRRCVKSILENWEGFQKSFPSADEMTKEIHKLPSPVLADILMNSMNQR